MNRLIFMFISLALCCSLYSQNLSLAGSVVASAGAYSVASNNKLSWTIGEPLADILTSANHSLTVGFQQNWDKIVGIEELVFDQFMVPYPNPVTDKIFIKARQSVASETFIELLNFSGARVYSEKLSKLAADQLISIDISSLSGGLYFLHIYSPRQKTDRVFKIVKLKN